MANDAHPAGEKLMMPDADVVFYPEFFNQFEGASLYKALEENIHWTQQQIRVPGGKVPLPRLTAWYGDEGKDYSYSGITVHPEPWIAPLLSIRARVESVTEVKFNSVLLNLYRDAMDSVSWHSDDEPELGTNPIIASVSFGATRTFQFRHKKQTDLRHKIDLTDGSLLLMRGTTQHFWKHQIPKTKVPCGPRINLTFRIIR